METREYDVSTCSVCLQGFSSGWCIAIHLHRHTLIQGARTLPPSSSTAAAAPPVSFFFHCLRCPSCLLLPPLPPLPLLSPSSSTAAAAPPVSFFLRSSSC